MADTDLLVQKLREARSDYDCEFTWGKFLLNAYGGTGGFAGKVQPPALSHLGWAASAYGIGNTDETVVGETSSSYLDAYPREDSQKYQKRCDIAHYQNYVAAILDLLVSYTLKHPPTLENIPKGVMEWRENVTVTNLTFAAMIRHVISRRAALLGWCPVVIDMMPRPAGLSYAQVEGSGVRPEPFMAALTPANVLSWYRDQLGVLQWVKLKLCYCRQPDPLGPKQEVETYKVYTRTHVYSWDVVEDKVIALNEPTTHPFGVVPMISFQHRSDIEEPIRGISMVGDASIASRRLFNLDSELDEHLRSTVFALLQVPVPSGQQPPNELIGGSGNAVPIPADSAQPYAYVAPPSSVADTLETRIETTILEIFRRARTQFRQGTALASGTSKQWDFEETNRLIADFAAQLASAELDVYKLIARASGEVEATIEKMRVIPSSDFGVEDLASDLDNLLKALDANLGATMNMMLKRRISTRLVENMSEEDMAQVNSELLEARDFQLQAQAEGIEIDAAGRPVPKPEPSAGIDGGGSPGENQAA